MRQALDAEWMSFSFLQKEEEGREEQEEERLPRNQASWVFELPTFFSLPLIPPIESPRSSEELGRNGV